MSWLSGIFAILGTLLSLFGGSNTSRTVYGPRVTEFRGNNSKYGIAIPQCYGTIRQSGNLIWATSVTEVGIEETECTKSGGLFGLGGTKSCTTTIRYEYYQSFAIAFAKGPADAYIRFFADGQLMADYRPTNQGTVNGLLIKNEVGLGVVAKVTKYYGDENNVPDPYIARIEGEANTPAYEDMVYAVFKNIQLKPYGNRIPVITAEIAYAAGGLDNTNVLIGDAPTTQAFINPEYFITQDSTTYTITDIYNRQILNTNNYLFATGLFLPYADRNNHVYSSYMYTGSASNLIQYNLISGEPLWAYDLGPSTTNIVALDFDYAKSFVIGVSNTGVYKLPMSPAYTTPVVRSTTGVLKLKDNLLTHGVVGSDVVIDEDRTIWAVRHDTTGNKKTYVVKYTIANGYVGNVIGPITHSSYTNPVDSSTVLAQGDFITVDENRVYIGSSTYNWIVAIAKTGNVMKQLLSTAITTNDRTNFRSAKFQNELRLESGVVVSLGTLTVKETLDLDTLFTGVAYGAVTDAYAIPAIDAYAYYDSTSLYFGYLRFSAIGDTLKNILESIVLEIQTQDRPSLLITDVDFTTLSGIVVDGYTIDAQKDLVTIIDPLSKVFIFDIVEQDGKLVSIVRGSEVSEVTIPEAELTSNAGDTPLINITRLLDSELPLEVSVTYQQASLDYQQATQRARKLSKLSTDLVDVAVDIVLTSSKALQAAEIMLKDAWQGKEQYAFTLPRKYAYLSPTDLITLVTTGGDVLSVRLNSITYGENMTLECTGSSFNAGVYQSNSVGEDGDYTPLDMVNAYPIKLYTFEIPYFYRGSENSSITYYALTSLGTGTYSVYKSVNAGAFEFVSTYSQMPIVASVLSVTNDGNTTTKLYGPENLREIDYINEIIVQVQSTTTFITTNARDEVFTTLDNYLVIGEEVIFVKNIEEIGTKKYKLSGLYRDRLGYMPVAYTSHDFLGEYVIVLSGNIGKIPTSTDTTTLLLYANANNNWINTSNYAYSTPSNISLKAFPPIATAVKSGDDLVVSIERRDRIDDNWITHGDLVNSETQEKYGIDIYNADGTLIRTQTVSDLQTITYTAANQTTDFGGVQTDYYIKVMQYNSLDQKGFETVLNYQTNNMYFNDMSAETPTAQLSNSTKTWSTTNVTYLITSDNYLELYQTASGNKALKLDDKLVVRNAEVLLKFKIETTGGFSVIFRGKDDVSGLAFTINSTLSAMKFSYFSSGVEGTAIVSTSKSIEANTWYYLKAKNIESLILAKVWKAHLYEPPSWDLTGFWAQDRECGWVGLGQQVNGSKTQVSQIKVTVL